MSSAPYATARATTALSAFALASPEAGLAVWHIVLGRHLPRGGVVADVSPALSAGRMPLGWSCAILSPKRLLFEFEREAKRRTIREETVPA